MKAALILLSLSVLIVALAAIVWFGQRLLVYRPDGGRVTPASEGLSHVAEVVLTRPGGARVVCWYTRAVGDLPTVLYFHGNGGGLYDRSARIRIMQADGFGVLMMSYRGFSGGTGYPSETANVADAGAAYDWLRDKGVPPERIVLFGESLGTGVAVQVASARKVAGVVLDSPFTSLVDVAAIQFPLAPVRLVMRDHYVSIDMIGRIGAPLLVLHGEDDRVVPFALGKRLFAAAAEPKEFHAFARTGHLVPLDGPAWPMVRGFLNRVAAAR